MRVPKLAEEAIQQRLGALPHWRVENGMLTRTFVFKDFLGSIQFVNRLAEAAEKADHHPDMDIRYSKVTVALSTHDSGGITEKDFALAGEADAAAGENAG